MINILPDLALIAGLGGGCALLLLWARKQLPEDPDTLTDTINHVLPQTQCAQCGYPGCRPYAEAIAAGEAINRCPPGGHDTIVILADLLGREVLPLAEDLEPAPAKAVVQIREDDCIGCALCIPACPVDAIVGTQQQMHTVIESTCTGCELCLEPCPVDCIDLVTLPVRTVDTALLEHPSDNACINCGECATACPRDLQPHLLYWYRKDATQTQSLKLDHCIECRRCDRVCPSELPLTEVFQASKLQQANHLEQEREAALAEQRYQARQARMMQAVDVVEARPSRENRKALLASLVDEEQS